jgi:Lrp/AsnC family transcriptional regulator, leucine-responsive regulatory protein
MSFGAEDTGWMAARLADPFQGATLRAIKFDKPCLDMQDIRMKLDRTDQAILAELQRDGRLSNRDLADKVHLSESACLRRVRALEEAGVIDRYAALVSQNKVGLPGNVFVSITLNRQEQADLAAFEEAVKRVPEVMECYLMTGAQDYLLRVVVSDTADFERLHSQHLTRLPGVARVQSSFALRTVRKGAELPLRS